MNNCKGFSFIEAITALVVTTGLLLLITPLLTLVYEERVSIQQEKKALFYLSKEIVAWINTGELPMEEEQRDLGTVYSLRYAGGGEKSELKICISWKGANRRFYEICKYGKR